MSFWQRFGRSIDSLLSGGSPVPEVESSRVESAIRLIQNTLDEQQRERRVRRVRISDLDDERQERLTRELRQLLAEAHTR